MRWKSSGPTHIRTDDLHAYVDGMLTHERAKQVETYLAQNPTDAAKVAEYREINHALGSELRGVLEEPVPAGLLDAVYQRRTSPMLRIAASVAWLAIGIGIGWFGNVGLSPQVGAFTRLAQEVETAYTVYSPELAHPVEISAGESEYLSAWLSDRLGRSVPIPNLNELNYAFLGGRLLTGYRQPAAMLMYQDSKGRRIVLYVSNEIASDLNTPMKFANTPGAGVITWAHNGMGFGVAGNFVKDELMPAANSIRAQIPA